MPACWRTEFEPALDFIDDVAQPQQILLDPFQSPQRFDLLDFEAADAGGLFENRPAIARRRLQQDIDFALLDDAIGFGRRPGAGKKIADIAQAARLAVEQIFAFAAAIHAARDGHFGRIDRQPMVGIVEHQRRFGRIQRPAAGRAVEDDVDHLLAAEILDALLAENPADGVDDVRLARAVGPDDHRDSGGKFEAGFVGEAFEADKFQRLEHGHGRGVELMEAIGAAVGTASVTNARQTARGAGDTSLAH